MFKNYLISAFRFLKRNKLFAAINALGLSIALAASFVILLYVINELSFDKCHKNRKQVYRVLNYYLDFKNTRPQTPYILAQTLKDEFPQVIKSTNTAVISGFKLKHGEELIGIPSAIASDSELFDILTIPLIEGSPGTDLLSDVNSIVLSRELSEKFFPGQTAIGKEIIGIANNQEYLFVVKGVFENFPPNSTFKARCLVNKSLSVNSINLAFSINNAEASWMHDFWTTWVLLSGDNMAADLEREFRNLEAKYIGEKTYKNFSLQKLTDIYLHSDEIVNTGIRGNMKNIRLFSSIAFLIILVATINYIILSTVVSTGRSKEIGMRKTNGADNRNIRQQLLGESILLAVLVLPIALILMQAAMPYAGKLFQYKLQIIGSNMWVYVLAYLLLTLFIGLCSGIYTSAYLSRLKVVQILKNNRQTGRNRQLFRSSLIVVQLVIFCVFVTCVFIIRSQYQYALKKDTGFYTEDIILIELNQGFKGYSAYLNSVRSNPNVISAAGSMQMLPTMSSMSNMVPLFTDKTKKIQVEGMAIDYNFLKTMGIQLIEGRDFSEEFGTDLKQSVILNESAVKQLGISDPIGKIFLGKSIIGIVKDFNLHSIRTHIPPLNITITDRYIRQIVVRYKSGTLDNLLPTLEDEWKKVAPDQPFRYSTIREIIQNLYSTEKNLSTIVSFFALFTLLIAAFGLFGLTSFTTCTRTKEIGIKKVLGNSGKAIVYSFLKSTTILVFVASLLAIPITLHFMTNWLNGFFYHTTINWWFFAATFGIAVVVVLLTVVYHSWRAATRNPVEALRYE